MDLGGEDGAILTFIVALPFALAVAVHDLRTMQIPNWLTGGAAVAFLAVVFATLPQEDAIARVIGAAVVLAVCFLFFALGAMGGGDGKAAAAFALLVAPWDAAFTLILLSVTALIGLGVIAVLRRTVFAGGGEWAVWSAERRFPYGVALGATLIIYLALVAFLVN